MLPFFNEKALLNPQDLIRDKASMPFSMIVTWQTRLLQAADKRFGVKKASVFRCGIPVPVYTMDVKGETVGIVNLPIGAPSPPAPPATSSSPPAPTATKAPAGTTPLTTTPGSTSSPPVSSMPSSPAWTYLTSAVPSGRPMPSTVKRPLR